MITIWAKNQKNKPASGHAGYTGIRPLAFFTGLMTPSRSEQAAPLAPVIPRNEACSVLFLGLLLHATALFFLEDAKIPYTLPMPLHVSRPSVLLDKRRLSLEKS